MDLLSQHEAFLRAIFDAPEDDTPRLVYADFLQENGEEDRAAFIRWQCGRGEKPERMTPVPDLYTRGFKKPPELIELAVEQLRDVESLRQNLVRSSPEYFAVPLVGVFGGRITSAEPFDVLFGLSAFARVTELDLEGEIVEETESSFADLVTYHLEPVITTAAVAALAQHRGVRRITSLDLRNNELDNDAARALVKSPYLDNLECLQLLEGNRLRGKVWQQVIERFGEDVVG